MNRNFNRIHPLLSALAKAGVEVNTKHLADEKFVVRVKSADGKVVAESLELQSNARYSDSA